MRPNSDAHDAPARPDPDALLAVAAREDARRGRLKIFFGAAPGVGKTYAMLEAARRRREAGEDVVVGLVETHGRGETAALLEGLEVLPRRRQEHRGTQLEEFDLDAALRRRPGLLLVDELAHTNAPGSRHPKRWQDVLELLDAGVHVHTTLNVQHLESLNDVVAQITWVRVRETVPDAVLERADEVELVDLPPDALLERLREGKVYLPEQALRAASAFFRKGNLLALRELALRRMAQRVDSDVLAYRREHGIATTWPAAERILVGIGPSASGARLVRAAARMAAGLRAEWVAACVETPGLAIAAEADRGRVGEHQRLAESLGAEVVTLTGESVAEALLAFARGRDVTRIIIGKPTRPRWRELLRGSLVDEVVRGSGDIDVHVISGVAEPPGSPPPPRRSSPARHYLSAFVQAAAISGVAGLLFEHVDRSDIIMLYILGIMLVAVRYGRGPAALSAVLSVLAYDFFYVPPYGTFMVHDGKYVLTFAVMLVVSLVISGLTARIRLQAEAARVREARTASLYSLSRELAQMRHKISIATCAARHIGEMFDGRVVILLLDAGGELTPVQGTHAEITADPRELSVAQWAVEHGPAGRDSDTLPAAAGLYLPLTAADRTVGVLGIVPTGESRLRDPVGRQLLATFCGQTALALQRVLLAQEAQSADLRARTEELRSSLLSSVSHDLRTPLATITGSASTLLEQDDALPRAVRRDLAQAIYEEAARLGRLVANLLDMTRLDSGTLVVHKEWIPIEEPIGAALGRLEALLGPREVKVTIAPELPLVPLDAVLVEQLLVNLLENAVKYGGPGPIEIEARRRGERVMIEVADHGPGLPPGGEERIFEKFYQAAQGAAAGGVGLGLAICRAIAAAHDAHIEAADRPGGGAVFRVTFPVGGPQPSMPAEPPELAEARPP
jgi:two-component system sensor histidine kinase KdpD